jgi:hypothetical protein
MCLGYKRRPRVHLGQFSPNVRKVIWWLTLPTKSVPEPGANILAHQWLPDHEVQEGPCSNGDSYQEEGDDGCRDRDTYGCHLAHTDRRAFRVFSMMSGIDTTSHTRAQMRNTHSPMIVSGPKTTIITLTQRYFV